MKLMERAPDRVVAGVLVQTVGHRDDDPDVMYRSGRDVWAPELLERRPDLNMATLTKYLDALYRVQPEFVYSVSKDFARSCQTPMLVLPDETLAPAAIIDRGGLVSLPERRDHRLPLARSAGAQGSDHQSRSIISSGA